MRLCLSITFLTRRSLRRLSQIECNTLYINKIPYCSLQVFRERSASIFSKVASIVWQNKNPNVDGKYKLVTMTLLHL